MPPQFLSCSNRFPFFSCIGFIFISILSSMIVGFRNFSLYRLCFCQNYCQPIVIRLIKRCVFFLLIALAATSVRADLAAKSYVDSAAAAITTALNAKENLSNKLKSVSGGEAGVTSAATDDQYPSAKAVWDSVSAAEQKTDKNAANGYAGLDSSSLILVSQIPQDSQPLQNSTKMVNSGAVWTEINAAWNDFY